MKGILLPSLIVTLLLLLFGGTTTAATATETIDYAKQDEAVEDLVEWTIEKGGYFHPNVEIRRWDASDPTSYFGAFLNGSVKKDELLITIPGGIKIQLHDDYRTNSTYDDVICVLAWELQDEYKDYIEGEDGESDFEPYLYYLDQQSEHQIPAMWSEEGKKLLEKVQGKYYPRDFEADPAPGSHLHDWIQQKYGWCLEWEGEELDEWFLAVVLQRGYDYALIPIYDMLNHNNGDVNTITKPTIFDKNSFGVYALRDMKAGEELLYSYYDCPDCRKCRACEEYPGTPQCKQCESTLTYWGTSEMLRDFGFVEPYPHRYYFWNPIDEKTMLSQGIIVDKDEENGSYAITCFDGRCPSYELIEPLAKNLEPMFESDILPLKDTLPPLEYFTIQRYHETLLNDFQEFLKAVKAANEDDSKKEL